MDIFTSVQGQFINSQAVGVTGKVYRRRRTAGSTPQQLEIATPTGYQLTDTPGDWCTYNNRMYAAGIGSDNAVLDENFRFFRLGLPAPTFVPVVAASAGPGRTGACRIAIAYYDSEVDEWGPLSGVSNEVNLSNQKATTTNIDSTAPEDRITHVGVFVSMDGASFRLSTKRQIGVTSVTEGVATLSLGFAFPATFKRFPRCTLNKIYNERLILAGDALHPDVVYVSAIGHPERYEGLSFKTKNGEKIVSIVPTHNNVCLIMTNVNAYQLRGFRDADMSMTLLDPNVGAVNNLCVKYVRGYPVVVNQHGFWIYNGAFHNISRDRAKEWQTFYRLNRAAVEKSFAVVDPNEHVYMLFIRGASRPNNVPNPDNISIQTLIWTFDYTPCVPQLSGELGQPHWYLDVMARTVDSAGLLNLPGTERYDTFIGACDGLVRKFEDGEDDDDEDNYQKRLWITTKAYDMGDPGGSIQEGKRFTRLWSYIEWEPNPLQDKSWQLYARGGDEHAWNTILPDNSIAYWRESVLTSYLKIGAAAYKVYTPKTVKYHKPQRVTGRLLTMEYTAAKPSSFYWRGFGGVYGPGRATRKIFENVEA